MKANTLALLALIPTLVASPMSAKADDKHDHGAIYGGQFVEVEGHHGVEMVSDATSIAFYLSEEHKPMVLTGGSFKVIIQNGSDTKIVPLTIDGNKLSAKLDAELLKGAKLAMSGKDAHGHTIQARFVKE